MESQRKNMVRNDEKQQSADFETALNQAGFGRFHAELIAVCAISIISVGFQNGLSSYAFPSAQCELNLTSSDIGLLNVAFMAGGLVSCFLWGVLADVVGRKRILLMTHFLNAVVTTFCIVLSPSGFLTICRFLNGFFIGAPGSIIFSYLAEFQPTRFRSSVVCCCGLYFTASWLFLPLVAYVILPMEISLRFGDFFVLTSWRFFVLLLAVPELLVSLWYVRLPESPKFYVSRGDTRRALGVLRRMYAVNTGKFPADFPVQFLKREEDTRSAAKVTCDGKTLRILRMVIGQVEMLFSGRMLRITVISCGIMFANMFGVFGLGLWLPQLFARFDQYQKLYPNATSVTVRELSLLPLDVQNSTSCQPSFDSSVTFNVTIIAASSLVFNAIAGFLASKVSVKVVPLFSMLVGGISAASIYWLTSFVQHLAVACVFQATMVTANMTIGNIGVELFPTGAAAVGLCLVMFAGRTGAICSNLVFGYLADKNCELPIFTVAAVVLVGAALCVLVPEKRHVAEKVEPDDVSDLRMTVIACNK